MKPRQLIGTIIATGLVVGGCGGSDYSEDEVGALVEQAVAEALATTSTAAAIVPQSSTTTEAPTTTTTLRDTTTTAVPTTTEAVMAPSVSIYCPDDFGYEYGTIGKVTFGYQFSLGSAEEATFDIDYGDAKTYHSPDAAHAERNLFWHDYEAPGYHTVEVRMTADNGLEASDTCSFTYDWIGPPPTAPLPGPGSIGGGIFGSGFDAATCTYDGVPLWGSVQVVDYFPDFTVQVVNYFPDLHVQAVDYFANSCGKWAFVDYFPDFTVQFVDYFPDFTVQFVDYFPGT